ncbi:hypothetical protein LR032_00925 [Candidatus Bipolaricaulota bacterium]|nr:hypothetical protein [Candidatus Bipolaricaulota bacterium]
MKLCRCVIFLLSVLALALLTGSALYAETSATATVEVSWRILPFQSLTIDGAAGSGTRVVNHHALRQPTESDFAVGFIEVEGALTLIAASNIPWTVSVRAVEADMGRSDDGTFVKHLSAFSLRANGAPFFVITQFDQLLASGVAGRHRLTIDYRVELDGESHREGDYGLTLVYTITGG